MLKISIMGTRGIPAKHGGFETFAENLATYLMQKGWKVSVYCQEEGNQDIYEDFWNGIRLIHVPVTLKGPIGTVVFDLKSTVHAADNLEPILTLGYNTAIFFVLYRLKGIKNVTNMDGVEWCRKKWSIIEKIWLYVNEKIGAFLSNHLIADHPEIKNMLSWFVSADKISVIPYSADTVALADESHLIPFGLNKNKYVILIARAEPENSIIEIVRAYSCKKRGIPLIVVGEYDPKTNIYQKKVIEQSGGEVHFIGAIYDKKIVQSLRYFARFYIHGHTVGGTNPSLVEALGVGSAVLAHDNKFNRWVTNKGAIYFTTEKECAEKIEVLLQDDDLIAQMREYSRKQFINNFSWDRVYPEYEKIFLKYFYSGINHDHTYRA